MQDYLHGITIGQLNLAEAKDETVANDNDVQSVHNDLGYDCASSIGVETIGILI